MLCIPYYIPSGTIVYAAFSLHHNELTIAIEEDVSFGVHVGIGMEGEAILVAYYTEPSSNGNMPTEPILCLI